MKKVFKYFLIALVVLGIGIALLLNNLSDSRWSEAIEYYSDKYDFSTAANNHKANSGSDLVK